jgi:hypothetical protein
VSYVIRHPDGRYLKVWHAVDDGAITRVDLVAKKDASSYRSVSEARHEVLDQHPGSNFTVEVR